MWMHSEARFVGIDVDVSKAELEIGLLPAEQFWTTPNDEAGRQELAERLRALEPALIVLEASGGYETPVAIHLVAVGLPVAVIDPDKVRAFASAKGQTSPSGHIDARVLALFAQTIRPKVRPLRDQQSSELDELFRRRRQIVEQIIVEKKGDAQSVKHAGKNTQADTAQILRLERSLDEVNFELKTLIRLRHRMDARSHMTEYCR